MRVQRTHSNIFRRAELPDLSAITHDVKVYAIPFLPFANASAKQKKDAVPSVFGFFQLVDHKPVLTQHAMGFLCVCQKEGQNDRT